MKAILILGGSFLTTIMTAQITAPGIVLYPAGGQVTAISSPRFVLKPEKSGRSIQMYAEQKSGDSGKRYYLCLFVEEKDRVRLHGIDLNKAIDEAGSERLVVQNYTSSIAYFTTLLSLEELKAGANRELSFTFHGDASQIDVKLPSVLASNFLARCEQIFGTTNDSTNLAVESKFSISSKSRTIAESKVRATVSGKHATTPKPSKGGVSHDATESPFGDYDTTLLNTIEQGWKMLLTDHSGKIQSGKVVIAFRLSVDGRITGLTVKENNTDEFQGLLCQSAILNPSPYPKWPTSMRQSIAGNYRDIHLTFYYD